MHMYIRVHVYKATHVQAQILTPTLGAACLCQQIAASQQPFRQV